MAYIARPWLAHPVARGASTAAEPHEPDAHTEPHEPDAHTDAQELGVHSWRAYFEELSRRSRGMLITVEVVGAPTHSQRHGRTLRPLHGIAYRGEADVLELMVGARPEGARVLRYFIAGPRCIHLDGADGSSSILVNDASGTRTLIRLTPQQESAAAEER